MAEVIYTYKDYSGKSSSVRFPLAGAAVEATLRAAVEAATSANLNRVTNIASVEPISTAASLDEDSTVKLGLRIHVADDVNGESGYFTIPSPDTNTLEFIGDDVNMNDAGAGAALVAAIETHVVSRDGNAVTVQRIERVGRNR